MENDYEVVPLSEILAELDELYARSGPMTDFIDDYLEEIRNRHMYAYCPPRHIVNPLTNACPNCTK